MWLLVVVVSGLFGWGSGSFSIDLGNHKIIVDRSSQIFSWSSLQQFSSLLPRSYQEKAVEIKTQENNPEYWDQLMIWCGFVAEERMCDTVLIWSAVTQQDSSSLFEDGEDFYEEVVFVDDFVWEN